VVDLEIVTIADAAQDRPQDRLVDVLDPLAAGADQVMMMLWYAGDVRGHVTRPLEPRRHARFDLCLEGAVHRGEAEAWVAAVKALVELLRGGGLALGGQSLRDDHPLFGEASAAGRYPLREDGPRCRSCHMHRILVAATRFEYDSH
jgi:hypothetical protein